MSIPKYTEEENIKYNELLKNVSNTLNIDKNSSQFNRSDERSRMFFYLMSEQVKQSPEELFLTIENGINRWKKIEEPKFWIENWTNVLDNLKNGNWDILYESSDLMQELRSNKPFNHFFIDEKLRYKVIEFIFSK